VQVAPDIIEMYLFTGGMDTGQYQHIVIGVRVKGESFVKRAVLGIELYEHPFIDLVVRRYGYAFYESAFVFLVTEYFSGQ
jgi:hypothetical protein